jgi:hypothetical protein
MDARLSGGFLAAEPRHWFVGRVLDLMVERAGFLDSAEPDPELESYTTGDDVIDSVCSEAFSKTNLDWESCAVMLLPNSFEYAINAHSFGYHNDAIN